MEDDYGADDALFEALAAADAAPPARRPAVQQPTPQKMQQPTPQRLDRPPPGASSSSGGPKVVQPTPQALPQKHAGSSILVSPRQRGNPVLTSIRSMPWEYSDIPADFALGSTTGALFLSLKYHRLHPEYIYTRIRNLQGRYNLRILLTMVDIPNHEDSLRELSKTSLVNNVTIVLCWSAAEAARYIELYKSYEGASFAAIRGQQPSSYGDRLVDFVTTPRSLNKSDAVALVANFGSLRNAVNADPEQLGMINGWGGIKVKRWAAAVEEPFRSKKAAKRNAQGSAAADNALPLARVPVREMTSSAGPVPRRSSAKDHAPGVGDGQEQFHFLDDDDDDDDDDDQGAAMAAAIEDTERASRPDLRSKAAASRGPLEGDKEDLSGGVASALAKLRELGA